MTLKASIVVPESRTVDLHLLNLLINDLLLFIADVLMHNIAYSNILSAFVVSIALVLHKLLEKESNNIIKYCETTKIILNPKKFEPIVIKIKSSYNQSKIITVMETIKEI